MKIKKQILHTRFVDVCYIWTHDFHIFGYRKHKCFAQSTRYYLTLSQKENYLIKVVFLSKIHSHIKFNTYPTSEFRAITITSYHVAKHQTAQ